MAGIAFSIIFIVFAANDAKRVVKESSLRELQVKRKEDSGPQQKKRKILRRSQIGIEQVEQRCQIIGH